MRIGPCTVQAKMCVSGSVCVQPAAFCQATVWHVNETYSVTTSTPAGIGKEEGDGGGGGEMGKRRGREWGRGGGGGKTGGGRRERLKLELENFNTQG